MSAINKIHIMQANCQPTSNTAMLLGGWVAFIGGQLLEINKYGLEAN